VASSTAAAKRNIDPGVAHGSSRWRLTPHTRRLDTVVQQRVLLAQRHVGVHVLGYVRYEQRRVTRGSDVAARARSTGRSNGE
jgi:predicted metallo-beta-lactamase superfamily hydrolase